MNTHTRIPIRPAIIPGIVPAIALTIILVMALAACDPGDDIPQRSGTDPRTAAPAETRPGGSPVFGLALGSGGLGDRGFNDMQYSGMVAAANKYDVDFFYEEPIREEPEPLIAAWDRLLANGCTVIICCGGFEMRAPLHAYAPKHPQTMFVLMDNEPVVSHPNVASTVFVTAEAAYLAGILSARMSKTKVLGAVGGRDVPTVRDFLVGFEAGARHAEPGIRIEKRFVAQHVEGASPWRSPDVAEKLAASLIRDRNADIVFAVAGGSSLGVFAEATRAGKFAIGVDADQDHLARGVILTSVMKRLDKAMDIIVQRILDGKFDNTSLKLDMKDGGVGLSPMTHTRHMIPKPVLDEIAAARQDIISGQIKVPTVR